MMRAAKQSPSVKSVQEVGRDVQAAVWSEVTTFLFRGLKALLERLLEEEVSTPTRYERTPARQGHRNGHYTRDLIAQHGPLHRMRVPRLLDECMDFTCFDSYQRRRGSVDATIGQLFLQGISTRKVKFIAKDLFGASLSPGMVSNVASVLGADLKAYQTKPLTDDILFLFLDGISQKARKIGVEGKVMLCAFGIHTDSTKGMLSFRPVDGEDTENWRERVCGSPEEPGLKGKALRLIIVDGNLGLLKALREIHPLRRIQRCIAHKLRNVVIKLKRAQRQACMGEAKRIFGAPSRTEAIRRFRE